ncbi:MAG: bifunctional folylpolyglutamate synthase/dihydrofolate synthase [Actinomycetota bacterium]
MSPVDAAFDPTDWAEHPAEAFAWLDAHVNLESLGVPLGLDRRAVQPTLARMEALAALLGSPQLEYGVIHLTGTNGKTSVARIASALLVEAGMSTGTYTSPHLERVNERMSWEGVAIPDAVLADRLAQVALIEPHLPDVPSYFEILTGAALTWFADVAVEVAVVEVGLGGTWDATNVVDGDVAVVTNVSIDHVDYLGSTREAIAADKAGIVKPGSILVLGETDPALVGLFTAREPSRVLLRERDFGVTRSRIAHGGRVIDLFTPRGRYDEVFVSLHGAHQADNAAIAVAAVETFADAPLSEDMVGEVLGRVRSPGRLEVVGHEPLVVLDGAHNVAGAQAFARAMADEFPTADRTLVVGILREKDPTEMLEALGARSAARLVCCAPPSARARDPLELADAARRLGIEPSRIDVVHDAADAVDHAVAETPADGQIVVTGSLYVVGAARVALGVDRRDG